MAKGIIARVTPCHTFAYPQSFHSVILSFSLVKKLAVELSLENAFCIAPATNSAPRGSQSAVPATNSAHGGSQSAVPATKSARGGSQSAAPAT